VNILTRVLLERNRVYNSHKDTNPGHSMLTENNRLKLYSAFNKNHKELLSSKLLFKRINVNQTIKRYNNGVILDVLFP
jgi:hypothetical protein